MDGFFGEPSARAVNSPPPSCYKDSIEQVAPAMPRARHEPNWIVISRCGSIAIFYQERRNAHAQYRDRCVQRKKYSVRNEARGRDRVRSVWSSAHKRRNVGARIAAAQQRWRGSCRFGKHRQLPLPSGGCFVGERNIRLRHQFAADEAVLLTKYPQGEDRSNRRHADRFVRSGLLAGASTDQAAGGYISGASASGATILPNDLHSDQGKGWF